MLSKLYKYEFRALFRCFTPIYIGLVGLAIFNRVFFLLDDSINIVRIIQKSCITLYILGIIAMFAIGAVAVVIRFYRNMLSAEGYLTLTLPFKMSQHILCKLICGAVMIILNFICLLVSLFILFIGYGDSLETFIRGALKMLACALDEYGGITLVVIAEFAAMAIVALAAALLMTYTAMAIGQQFKSRIGASVIAYICIYAALQTVSFVAIFIASRYSGIDSMYSYGNTLAVLSVVLGAVILYQITLSVIYFAVTNRLLSKRLNLA